MNRVTLLDYIYLIRWEYKSKSNFTHFFLSAKDIKKAFGTVDTNFQ